MIPQIVLVASLALAPAPTTFDSLEEAAVYALSISYRLSHYYEVGGVLVKIGDKYAIGAPHTDWSGDSLEFGEDHDPDLYTGVIVGDYHTHPCNSHTHVVSQFSPQDLLGYRMFHVQGFMGDLCTGDVHTFVPGVDKRPDEYDGTSPGRIVGKFKVDGQVLDGR